jgi:urea transport system permease protein
VTATSARFPGRLAGKFQRNCGTLVGFLLAALALLVVAPATLSDFRLSLLGRFICYAIVAVGIGLAWGRGGMLTLGQGVFFGLGGYVMAMHLKLADAGPSGFLISCGSTDRDAFPFGGSRSDPRW